MIKEFHAITGATLQEFMDTDISMVTRFIEMNEIEVQIYNQVQERNNDAKSSKRS